MPSFEAYNYVWNDNSHRETTATELPLKELLSPSVWEDVGGSS